MKRSVFQLGFSFIVVLATCISAFSQADVSTATIKGMVTDSNNAVVAGATVTAKSIERGVTRTARTDAEGNYVLQTLQPGMYEVRIEASGFETTVLSKLELTVGLVGVYDVQLKPGGVSAEVIVTADAPCFAADDIFCNYISEAARIVEEGLATPAQVDQIVDDAIAEAAAQKADLVVLPETLTYYATGRTMADCSETVPGPSTEYFGSLAKRHDMYIVAGLIERDGRLVYNTAALVGPDGKLVGKYRKATLPRSEIESGIQPGDIILRDHRLSLRRLQQIDRAQRMDLFLPPRVRI